MESEQKTYEGIYGFVRLPELGMIPVEVVDVRQGVALVKNMAGYGNQFEVSRDKLYLCEHFPGQIVKLIKQVQAFENNLRNTQMGVQNVSA